MGGIAALAGILAGILADVVGTCAGCVGGNGELAVRVSEMGGAR